MSGPEPKSGTSRNSPIPMLTPGASAPRVDRTIGHGGDRSRGGERPAMPRGFEARKDRGDRAGRDFRPSAPRGAGERSWGHAGGGTHDRFAARSEERSGGRPSWAGDGGRPAGGRIPVRATGFRRIPVRTPGACRWVCNAVLAQGARMTGSVVRPSRTASAHSTAMAHETGARSEGRPWAQRGEGAGSDRPARSWQDRPATGRPSFDRSGSDRPSFDRSGGDRFGNDRGSSHDGRPGGDRPRWDAPRGDRPSGDRPDRGARPSWNDRAASGDRPDRGSRPAWNDRPASGDRPDRGARPGGFRAGGPRTEWAPRGGSDRPAPRGGGFDRDADRGPRSDRPAREGSTRWSSGAPGSRSWSNGDRPGARADTRGPSGPGGRPAYGGGKPGGRPGARGASAGGFQGSPKLTWRASRPK